MKVFLIILAVLYVLSPYDILPDWLVGFGWIDDLAVLGLVWWYIYRYSKRRYAGQGPSSAGRGDGHSSNEGQGRTTDGHPPRDPYQILGINRNASQSEIRHAYKELVNKYHPDKVSHLGQEFQALAEERFRDIQEAYEQLTRIK
ncbi:MAG: DnaJ domain-containing protein [Desulfatiglandaceae bacterium]